MSAHANPELRPVRPAPDITDVVSALASAMPGAGDPPRDLAGVLHATTMETSTVADGLRSLAWLLGLAVDHVEAKGELSSSCYVVADCMRSMADRLDAAELLANQRAAFLTGGRG